MDKAFIIFVTGLQGAGKSALINYVTKNTDIIYLPLVSNRPLMENENNKDKHILTPIMFDRLKTREKITLISKQDGYDYGVYTENLDRNVVYITDYFAPELRDLYENSIAIYVKPMHLDYGKMKMLQKETNPLKVKKRLLEYDDANEAFEELNNDGVFDEVFVNNYKQGSLDKFLDLIVRFERQIKHEYYYDKIENF